MKKLLGLVVLFLNWGIALAQNAPVAANDTFTVLANQAASLPVTANDFDINGDPLSISLVAGSSNGQASVLGLSISYTPTPGFIGNDELVYSLCDSGNLCDTASVWLTIIGTNDPPTVGTNQFTLSDTVTAIILDMNATDANGDSIYYAAVNDLDSNNNLGAIFSSGSNLLFVRNGLACGTETFQYVICDPFSCDTGNVSITIECPAGVFLPQGFSPDGDGLNDRLVFTGLEYFAPAILKVFNRYGAIVYESNDYTNDWNGKLIDTDKAVPDGTYFYVLQLKDKRKFNQYLVIQR